MEFNIGDLVTRKSYNSDIIFEIEEILGNRALLRSVKLRLMADAPLNDLKLYNKNKKDLKNDLLLESYQYIYRLQRNLILNNNSFNLTRHNNSYRKHSAKILHLDGDKHFLDLSLQNYKNLNLNAKGIYIEEKGQPKKILNYLKLYKPDILVLTGHDGSENGGTYRTSNYFIEAVKIARNFDSDLDNLVIFAGACQSDYQSLIDCGANLASSPKGALIHFLDPILAVEKIAFTPITEVVAVKELVKDTITGEAGIGGVETYGKLRLCFPWQ